jgi:hypothetical protein
MIDKETGDLDFLMLMGLIFDQLHGSGAYAEDHRHPHKNRKYQKDAAIPHW